MKLPLILMLLGPAAAALGQQQMIQAVAGAEAGSWFGAVVAAADLDGDGVLDLVAGAPKGPRFQGWVAACSGATGRRLWRRDGERSGDRFGAALAVIGDVDQDGVPEIAVGAPEFDDQASMEAGALYLLSGRTGAVLRREIGQDANARFGAAVASAGDADGDNSPDVAASAPNYQRNGLSGFVRILRGTDFVEWRRMLGYTEGYGYHVSEMHDVVAAGPAIWVSTRESLASQIGVGVVYSTRTGQQLWGFVPGSMTVALHADLDGDSFQEVLNARPDWPGMPVYVASTSAAPYFRIHPIDPQALRIGSCMGPIGDVDGDAVTDYLAGCSEVATNGIRSGRVDGYSGRTGALLFQLFGAAYEEFGASCVGLGDVNGDGVADFAIGAPFASGSTLHDGVVRVYSGRSLQLRADVTEVSQAGGGTQQLDIDLGAGAAGETYVLLGSMTGVQPGTTLQGVHVPLNFDAYTSLTLAAANGPVLQNSLGSLDAQGRGRAVIRVPLAPSLVGLAVVHSCLWFDQSLLLRGATGAVPLRIRD